MLAAACTPSSPGEIAVEPRLGHLGGPKQGTLPAFVPRCGGSLGLVGTDAQLSARYGGGHHSGIVGGHHAVDRGVITDANDRLGSKVRIRAIHLEIAITHVERRRVLRGDYQVDAEPFGGADEVGGPVGGAGKEDDHVGMGRWALD